MLERKYGHCSHCGQKEVKNAQVQQWCKIIKGLCSFWSKEMEAEAEKHKFFVFIRFEKKLQASEIKRELIKYDKGESSPMQNMYARYRANRGR